MSETTTTCSQCAAPIRPGRSFTSSSSAVVCHDCILKEQLQQSRQAAARGTNARKYGRGYALLLTVLGVICLLGGVLLAAAGKKAGLIGLGLPSIILLIRGFLVYGMNAEA
jgi:hypothetical protein